MVEVTQAGRTGPIRTFAEVGKAKILVVDDDERNALALSTVLEELGQIIVVARSGEEALRCLLNDDFAVILLDLHMPGMDGYETAALIRARRRTEHIPILFLTAIFRDESHLQQAYALGAVDMVFKPVDPFVLKTKVSVFVQLYLKQLEIERAAELRHQLQEENFRVTTEKLVAERELRRIQERQQAILKALPICVHARRPQYPYGTSFVSAAVEKITGFSPGRFVAEPDFGISRVHADDVASVLDCLSKAVQTGSYSCEFRWQCADGVYRTLLDQGVVAAGETGEDVEIFGTILDVTELRFLEQQLVQAQKMETVGQLTGGIAHDFNNLLTVILGNLDLMHRRVADERVARQVNAMRHAAERGKSLTGQLLAFSRRQHLRPERLDLNGLIERFQPLLRQAVGEAVTVTTELGDAPVVCNIDAAQLESSLLNLAVNARDAMPAGGVLSIKTRTAEADEIQSLADMAGPPGEWVAIDVVDTGTGMATEVLERVYEPFFTTKDVGKGSGLGLSQVYGFVQQSGGAIRIASAEGAGTTLSIFLPVCDDTEAGISRTQDARTCITEMPRAPNKRILLVEDDASVLAVGIDLLTELGYDVVAATDARNALDVVRRDSTIDVIVTDIVMPGGMTGVDLAHQSRDVRPGLKILLTSGYVGEALQKYTDMPDTFAFIQKPFRADELAAVLHSVLHEQELGNAAQS